MTWARAAMLVVLASCGDKTAPAPAPTPARKPVKPAELTRRSDLITYQDMVAISGTGDALVTRKDNRFTVWTRAGSKLGVIDALAAEKPGDRVAISASGEHLFEVSDKTMRLVDVATKHDVWKVDDIVTVWGAPAISPDGTIIALPLEGTVMTVDATTGKDRAPIDGDKLGPQYPIVGGLSVPREAWFSRDGKQIAIRCGTDQEQAANHTIYIADLGTNQLVTAVLGHTGSIVDAQWLADGRLVTLDEAGTLRVIRDGMVEQTLALGVTGALVVADDLKTVATGNEQAVTVWRAGLSVAVIPRHRVDDPVWRLELVKDGVVVISQKSGVVRTYAIPAGTQVPAAAWAVVDPETRKRDAVIWSTAGGKDPRLAGKDRLFVAARAFADWQDAGASGIYRGPLDLDLIELYVTGGFVDEAHLMLASWLGRPRGGDDARAKMIGLALATAERSNEVTAPIAGALFARWPEDPEVIVAYTEAIAIAKPELAAATLRKATARQPHAVALWKQWLDVAPEGKGPEVYAAAQKALTADELAQLPAPK